MLARRARKYSGAGTSRTGVRQATAEGDERRAAGERLASSARERLIERRRVVPLTRGPGRVAGNHAGLAVPETFVEMHGRVAATRARQAAPCMTIE